jgi:hypothetical protein
MFKPRVNQATQQLGKKLQFGTRSPRSDQAAQRSDLTVLGRRATNVQLPRIGVAEWLLPDAHELTSSFSS